MLDLTRYFAVRGFFHQSEASVHWRLFLYIQILMKWKNSFCWQLNSPIFSLVHQIRNKTFIVRIHNLLYLPLQPSWKLFHRAGLLLHTCSHIQQYLLIPSMNGLVKLVFGRGHSMSSSFLCCKIGGQSSACYRTANSKNTSFSNIKSAIYRMMWRHWYSKWFSQESLFSHQLTVLQYGVGQQGDSLYLSCLKQGLSQTWRNPKSENTRGYTEEAFKVQVQQSKFRSPCHLRSVYLKSIECTTLNKVYIIQTRNTFFHLGMTFWKQVQETRYIEYLHRCTTGDQSRLFDTLFI